MNKKIYFTPGPSKLYGKIPEYIKEAVDNDVCSISHRSQQFKDLYAKAEDGVRKVLEIPSDYHVFFIASATEAMERIVKNCVVEKSFHVVGGSFGERLYQTALDYGKDAVVHNIKKDTSFSVLDMDIPNDVDTMFVTQCETSTGGVVPMSILKEMRSRHPAALTFVDVVSSAPYMEIDWTAAHGAFFSVQKGFGLPAGLGIMALSPCAVEKYRTIMERGGSIGGYHSIPSLLKSAEKNYTPETPNVLNMYLLGLVCEDVVEKGLSSIREETKEKAELIKEFVNQNDSVSFYIKDEEFRSETILVLDIKGDVQKLIKKIEKEGFVIGAGYGELKDSQIRIANFPAHTVNEMKQLIDVIKKVI